MALTTTATLLPRSTSRFTRVATWRMRSMSATEVPPNFIAIIAMFVPVCPAFAAAYIDGQAPLLNPDTPILTMTLPAPSQPSVDAAEVAKFSAIAAEWWDPAGKFAPLHKFNPVRLAFIRDRGRRPFRPRRAGRCVPSRDFPCWISAAAAAC